MCKGKKSASEAGPRRVVPKMHLDELYKVEKLGQETPLPIHSTSKVQHRDQDKVLERAKLTAEQLISRTDTTTTPIQNSNEHTQESKEQKQKDFKAFVAEHQQAKYPSNKVHTTRFNIFNFLPITIGLQFSKVINVFYLGNAILQSFPSVSTNDPIFTIIPLTVLVCLGILKEGLADLKRYKIDKDTNAAPVSKCTGRITKDMDSNTRKPKLNSSAGNIEFADPQSLVVEKLGEVKNKNSVTQRASRTINKVANLTESDYEEGICPQYEIKECRTDELVVGDIIIVCDDQSVPADCFLLASEKGGKLSDDGSCFISTDSLDGERNLKPKMAIMEVQEHLQEIIIGGGKNILLEVNCKTEPKADLYFFEGSLKVVLPDRQLPFVDLDLKQFVPRGAYVRNSGCQYLMVLYTGVETKLIMNQGKYRYKKSKIDLLIDLTLFLQVCLMFSFSGLLVIGEYNFSKQRVQGSDYLFLGAPPLWEMASKTFGSFYLLNNSFVPMDMVSGIEIIKIYITKMFENDAQMVVIDSSKLYKSNPNVPITDHQINESMVGCSAQNLTIHEDLGQVDFIFCDKTGTLTQNELIFRQFKIPQRAQPQSENVRDTMNTELVDDPYQHKNTLFQQKDGYTSVSDQIADHLSNHPEDEAELINFFKTMCLCHDLTMVVNGAGRAVLNGPSQDELCLVQMAQNAGLVEFIDRDSSQLRIKVKGKIEVYKNLKFFDFTSDRKMMTRIVQNDETKEVTILCKGADSSIFKRCLPVKELRMLQGGNYGEDSAEIRAMYKQHFSIEESNLVQAIDEFAKHGFRTLAFATRKLNSANIDDLTQEEIECNLTIAGVTSVEDLLQRDVAQCLRDFKEAGIKTWMLTGDKGDTARMIGLLCGMLSLEHDKHQKTLLGSDVSEPKLKTMLVQINEGSEGDVVEEFTQLDKAIQQGNKLELMVSGLKLVKILACKEALDIVEKVLLAAKAVVIYRASPSQKADVVNFIKARAKGKMTLAIGDGANDVNMIQSAHIGVGIKGKEGNQASMFADYSIPEFRGLRRLLFWHGRNFSQRLIDFICICIFKNMTISICLSIYNMWAGFSGLQQCEQIYWMMFNSNMTLIALLGNFACDQDIPFAWSAQDPYQQRIPGEVALSLAIKDSSNIAINDIKIHENKETEQMNIYELETYRIGFKITEYYDFHREFYQKKMMYRVFTFWLLSAFNGFVAFVVPCFGYGTGSSDASGKMEDLFGKAFISLVCIICAEHLIAYTRVRSWNLGVGAIAIFAMLNIFMDILLVEFMLGKEIQHRQLTEIIPTVKFWLCFCLASLTMSAPLYLFKVFKMLIYRPIYFQK